MPLTRPSRSPAFNGLPAVGREPGAEKCRHWGDGVTCGPHKGGDQRDVGALSVPITLADCVEKVILVDDMVVSATLLKLFLPRSRLW